MFARAEGAYCIVRISYCDNGCQVSDLVARGGPLAAGKVVLNFECLVFSAIYKIREEFTLSLSK